MLNFVVSLSVWKSLFLWSQNLRNSFLISLRGSFELVLYGIGGCLELVRYGIRDHFSHLKVPGHIAPPAVLCLKELAPGTLLCHKEPAQGNILCHKEAARDTLLCHKDSAQGARMYCTVCCLVLKRTSSRQYPMP